MTNVINLEVLPVNIYFIRYELNFSQTEFGELIGATKAQVYNFEKGHTPPKPNHINAIAEIAGITPEMLQTKRLTIKDLTLKIGRSRDNQKTLNLLASIYAQNIVILKNQSEIIGETTKQTAKNVYASFTKQVEAETEKILKENKFF